ncbi:MAG: DUF58 domain-containing protein [Proteobacteria bacterium]|nr:DUF58 domain-containing protein [Pseudomonadota bacterium]
MWKRAAELEQTPWLRRLLRLRYAIPLTPLGLVVAALAGWIGSHLARRSGDFVLHAAALIALLLVASAAVNVLAVTAVLALRLRRSRGAAENLTLESGVRATTGFSYPRFAKWPMVQVRLEWAEPRSVAVSVAFGGGRVEELVRPRERGSYASVQRRFVVRDIFGLTRFALHRTSPQRVRILPGRATATAHVVSQFASGDGYSHPVGQPIGDLLDMRGYGYGDPLRHVLWRAYARTRQLLVRTPERALIPSSSAAAFFVAGTGDEASASVARLFIEDGLLGTHFLFGTDNAEQPATRAAEALELLIASVGARRQGAARLEAFLQRVHQQRGRSWLLFVPPTQGPWLSRVVELAPLLSGGTVVLGIDAELGPPPVHPLKRLLFAEGDPARRRMAQVPAIVQRLQGCGLHVRVIHRPSGELVPLGKLQALAR